MNCEQYKSLTPKQQAEYIGKLVIAVQSHDMLFDYGDIIIRRADTLGIYETTSLHEDKAALNDIDMPIENGPTTQQT